MKSLTLTLLIGFLLVNQNFSQSKINFDFSGAKSFYDLCISESVDSNDVEKMLELPCYKNLFKYFEANWGAEYNKDLYRNMLLVSFLPDKYSIKPEHSDKTWILDYLLRLKKDHGVIKKYIDTVSLNIDENSILKRTKQYLPNTTLDETINVYFIVGTEQGNASSDGVFIDHYYEITPDKINRNLIPWIAHETHHFFRSQFNNLQPIADKSNHSELYQALYWLETEGFAERAGCTHKNLIEFINSEENKNDNYLNFKQYINQLNKSLLDYFNNKGEGNKILEILHPPKSRNRYHEIGHLMAYYIESIFGRTELVKQIGKPLDFLLKYNDAAKLLNDENAPIFDEQVISSIIKIRDKK